MKNFLPKQLKNKLRHKSLENNRKCKRSRMANYLQQVPQNSSHRNIYDSSPNQIKDNQYKTLEAGEIDGQMEQDYNPYHRNTHKNMYKNNTEYSGKEIDRYTTSPNIPQSLKTVSSQKRLGKSSARKNFHRKAHRPSQASFQENIPENVMKNRKNNGNSQSNSRVSKKQNNLNRALKEQSNHHQETEGDNVDDTFTYSMDPDSNFNSRIAQNGI